MQILCSITWCQDKISNLSIHCRAMRLRQWCLDWFCPTACRWVYFHRGQMVNILVTKGDCLIRAPVDHKWICIYIYMLYLYKHTYYELIILIIHRSARCITTFATNKTHFHDLCRSKRQGIHCPNHLHPATWILESWKSDGSLQHTKLPPEKLLFWVCQSYLLTLISGIFGIQNGHLANGNSVFGTSDSIYVIPWSIDVMGLKPPTPRTPKVWGKQSFQLYHEGWPRIEWSALRTVRTKHCFWWFLIPTRMIDVRGNETDTHTSHGNLFGWNVIILHGIRPSERITVDMLFGENAAQIQPTKCCAINKNQMCHVTHT